MLDAPGLTVDSLVLIHLWNPFLCLFLLPSLGPFFLSRCILFEAAQPGGVGGWGAGSRRPDGGRENLKHSEGIRRLNGYSMLFILAILRYVKVVFSSILCFSFCLFARCSNHWLGSPILWEGHSMSTGMQLQDQCKFYLRIFKSTIGQDVGQDEGTPESVLSQSWNALSESLCQADVPSRRSVPAMLCRSPGAMSTANVRPLPAVGTGTTLAEDPAEKCRRSRRSWKNGFHFLTLQIWNMWNPSNIFDILYSASILQACFMYVLRSRCGVSRQWS